MQTTQSQTEKPLFVVWHSVQRIIGIVVLTILGGGLGVVLVWVGLVADSATGLFLLASGLFFILVVIFGVRSMLKKEWRYAFYEDHFEVTHAGRNDCSIPMSEIDAVRCLPYDWLAALPSKVPGSNRHPPRIVINTYVQHSESFDIFQNPYNKEIKMRLCNWLTQKTEGRARDRSETAFGS